MPPARSDSQVVWFSAGIPKHKFLTWLWVLDRCPTRDRLLQWGLQSDPGCLLCNCFPESRSHIFYGCNYSWAIWNNLASRCGFSSSRDWYVLLSQLQALYVPKFRRQLLLLAWQASLYLIWTEKNNMLHRNNSKPVDLLIKEVDLVVRNRIATFRESNPAKASEIVQIWLA